jgi:hypothetical protein
VPTVGCPYVGANCGINPVSSSQYLTSDLFLI